LTIILNSGFHYCYEKFEVIYEKVTTWCNFGQVWISLFSDKGDYSYNEQTFPKIPKTEFQFI